MAMMHYLKKTPIQLALVILSVVLAEPFMPLMLKQLFYAISLTVKSGIVLALPIIIFSLLFRAALTMAERATGVLGVILTAVMTSTAVALCAARFVGQGLYNSDIAMNLPPVIEPLQPLWDGAVSGLIPNEWAMAAALMLGIGGALFIRPVAETVAGILDKVLELLLKIVGWVMPVFVAGFVVKLQHEGAFGMILQHYSFVLCVILVAQFSYIFALYVATWGGSIRQALRAISPMVPAAISGFSTMSSAASLPLIIQGVQTTTRHTHLARIVVPMLVNIHMIGECFADVILAYAVMKTYGAAQPALWEYAIFAGYFLISRFSMAAVPGGGIVVISPFLRNCLHFNEDMISLITALYILFDPFITTANVLGDGVMAQILDKTVNRWPFLAYSKQEIAQQEHKKSLTL